MRESISVSLIALFNLFCSTLSMLVKATLIFGDFFKTRVTCEVSDASAISLIISSIVTLESKPKASAISLAAESFFKKSSSVISVFIFFSPLSLSIRF